MAVEKLLTFDDVAEVLGVTTRTVYTFVKRGELIGLKVGRANRVDPSDLRWFIECSKLPRNTRCRPQDARNAG